ncbi:hypothetical protein WH87_07125 [Devosia epidermidihirudinis]|uniref:F5/8 type C domain-containing protein n=1 Tax=Devosia epidermidihirudinis TaxID=1293439 RepID=A0A0F5QFA1_9HYPH|nr:hypothetical protein [Devosia epidermidihirudinis]KKC38694.1 hypothetical protein WH87_07125 [Devosia epidermidihirudinis]
MKLFLLLPLLMFATPVSAAWEADSNTSKKSWFYAAFGRDDARTVELQVYCDFKFPGELTLLLFTGEDFDPRGEDAGDLDVTASVDGTKFGPLKGYNDDIGGERTIVVESSNEGGVLDVLNAMRGAKNPVQISYKQTRHSFSVEGIEESVGSVIDGCQRK